jgi:hypothetical protein
LTIADYSADTSAAAPAPSPPPKTADDRQEFLLKVMGYPTYFSPKDHIDSAVKEVDGIVEESCHDPPAERDSCSRLRRWGGHPQAEGYN